MKNIWTVYRFELTTKLRQKSVRVTTILFMLLFFIATCIPTLISLFSGGTPSTTEQLGSAVTLSTESEEDKTKFGLVILGAKADYAEALALNPFVQATVFKTEEALKQAVFSQTVEKGIVLESPTRFKLIADDISMYDESTTLITAALTQAHRNTVLKDNQIDPKIVDQASQVQIDSSTEVLGKNAALGFAFAYAGMFSIYMMIILYGHAVANSVAREKNDRTMELLITNTKPVYLIWGKVLAATVVSIGQLILIILAGALGVFLNQKNYPAFLLGVIRDGVSLDALVIFVVFALLGALMYYFLYAAVGALVSKVEEAASAIGPIQFVFIFAFFLSSFAMYMPDSLLMRVISIIPFTSLMSMFIRYSLTTVPVGDLLAALGLMVATVYFMAFLAIKIYRMGSLNYGNRIGFFAAIRKVFSKEAQA